MAKTNNTKRLKCPDCGSGEVYLRYQVIDGVKEKTAPKVLVCRRCLYEGEPKPKT